MIRGLQITLHGEELGRRIAERIRAHEATIGAFDRRIAQRASDLPFDIRVEDGFKTLGELETERQHYRDRVLCLTLLRDNIVVGEVYVLGKADLRLAELISRDADVAPDIVEVKNVGDEGRAEVDGLKLKMSGDEVRRLLVERIADHHHHAERWTREQARTPEEESEEEPRLPSEMCENEAERHMWRADLLRFIHDHVDAAGMYRLAEADLAFAELLPVKPGWLEQEEYEERTRVGFNLERLTKAVGARVPIEDVLLDALARRRPAE